MGIPVIPANPGSGPGQGPESSYFKMFWTPAFAGVTLQEIFYGFLNDGREDVPPEPTRTN